MKKKTEGYMKKILPARPAEASKGDFGKVLVVAGSMGMTGAAFLASLAALKSGCGLVYCAVPESERAVVAGLLPEAITIGLKSRNGRVCRQAVSRLEKAGKFDVMVIGPGLGCDEDVASFVFGVLENLSLPSVIDADAINCFSAFPGKLRLLKKLTHVITPHEGELMRLVGQPYGNKCVRALKLSRLTGGVAVLKGPGTVVAAGEKFYVNDTGCSALSKGGTGDVLAGLIGGLWAQKGKQSAFNLETAFESAVLGSWLHGRTGELAAKNLGERSVLASELLYYLPRAFSEIG